MMHFWYTKMLNSLYHSGNIPNTVADPGGRGGGGKRGNCSLHQIQGHTFYYIKIERFVQISLFLISMFAFPLEPWV